MEDSEKTKLMVEHEYVAILVGRRGILDLTIHSNTKMTYHYVTSMGWVLTPSRVVQKLLKNY